jgi:hypothetical protein
MEVGDFEEVGKFEELGDFEVSIYCCLGSIEPWDSITEDILYEFTWRLVDLRGLPSAWLADGDPKP